MRITYVGHATLLIDVAGLRILTDPNFDSSLGRVLARVTQPGIAIDQLPPLDAILLTHAHADHLSFKTLAMLPQHIPLYAPAAIARWLVRKGYRHAVGVDPDETISLGRGALRIHVGSATHRGSRFGLDWWRSAANMYLMESDEASVFFAGDTALTDTSHALVERVLWENTRSLDVALLPIGYAPPWKPGFRRGHLTAADALALFARLRASVMMPYHWGTFRHVTATAYDAINQLRKELETHADRTRVRIIEPGQTLVMDDTPGKRTSGLLSH